MTYLAQFFGMIWNLLDEVHVPFFPYCSFLTFYIQVFFTLATCTFVGSLIKLGIHQESSYAVAKTRGRVRDRLNGNDE